MYKRQGISDAMKQYNKKQDEIASDRYENRPVQKYYEGVSMTAIWAVKSLGIDPVSYTHLVIETKKTTDGELRVSYTGSVDLSIPDLSSYHLTNAAQKLEVEKDAGLYDGDKYCLLYTSIFRKM